jgi:hypothetical protein
VTGVYRIASQNALYQGDVLVVPLLFLSGNEIPVVTDAPAAACPKCGEPARKKGKSYTPAMVRLTKKDAVMTTRMSALGTLTSSVASHERHLRAVLMWWLPLRPACAGLSIALQSPGPADAVRRVPRLHARSHLQSMRPAAGAHPSVRDGRHPVEGAMTHVRFSDGLRVVTSRYAVRGARDGGTR